jgi:hypothetical protein
MAGGSSIKKAGTANVRGRGMSRPRPSVWQAATILREGTRRTVMPERSLAEQVLDFQPSGGRTGRPVGVLAMCPDRRADPATPRGGAANFSGRTQ